MTKYYKLLKDLPTFKKGNLFRLSDEGTLFLDAPAPPHWKDKVVAYHHCTLERFPNILKDWFEEVKSPSAFCEPKKGERYYLIDEFGSQRCSGSWTDNDLDRASLEVGNVFRTREEAENAVKRLKARKIIFDDAKGFKPNWEDEEQEKWTGYFDVAYRGLTVTHSSSVIDTPGPFFATRTDAVASITKHHDEWLVYLGVSTPDQDTKEELVPGGDDVGI